MRLTRFQSLILLFFLINLFFFIKFNNIPILWQQGEITFHNFYWASVWQSDDPFILKSGLRLTDFLKVFLSSEQIEGHFRPRHFSYLLEMLSFKFWQQMPFVTFRNYTLIFLHGLNVFLIFLLVKGLTKSRRAGLVAALLFLNAGVSLATLFYPFRNAKLLVTFIFLLSALVLVKQKEKPKDYSSDFIVFLLFFLGLFTDELFSFLLPLLLAYWVYAPPRRPWRSIGWKLAVTGGIFIALLATIHVFDPQVGRGSDLPFMSNYIKIYVNQFSQIQFVGDFFNALGGYFIRRNLGYWDFTFLGLLSFLSFGGFLYLMYKHKVRRGLWSIAALMLAGVVFQGLFYLREGMHIHINPPETKFFTILFFSYYYTYPATVLMICAIALLLAKSVSRDKTYIAILLFISIIGYSNMSHARQNIDGPLRFHRKKYSSERTVPKVLRIKEAFRFTGKEPIYMSFPSGTRPFFSRMLGGVLTQCYMDPKVCVQGLMYDCFDYAAMIPVLFLRDIEKGNIIVSLKNVEVNSNWPDDKDMLAASFFLDVVSGTLIDLRDLIKDPKAEPVKSIEGLSMPILLDIQASDSKDAKQVVFFVKGAGTVQVKTETQTHDLKQIYGQSYQMVLFQTADLFKSKGSRVKVSVLPLEETGRVSLLGPYFIR